MDLRKNICDNIKECEIKIGYREEDIELYYPEESLMELLGTERTGLEDAVLKFCESVREELGQITIRETAEAGRCCIRVPAEGVRYVHEQIPDSPFLTAFLKEIQIPGRKLEDIVQVFKKFSEQVKVERAEPGGWAVSFENPEIDPYIYYIEEDDFGLVYHRFTKEAYGALKEH